MKLARTALTSNLCAISVAVALFAGTARAAEFKEYIDFVETTGSQYVILDYTPKSNTVVTAKVDVRDTSVNNAIFCARDKEDGTTARGFTLFYLKGNDGWRFDYYMYKSDYVTKVTATPGTPVELTASGEALTIDGVVKKSYKLINFTARNPMMLFGSYEVGPGALTPSSTRSNLARVRLYSFTATEDGVTVLDLKPFVDTDGKFGLYDTVAKKPWYSQGSAAFTGGMASEVTLTDDPAVLNSAYNGIYTEKVAGTGGNKLVVSGVGLRTFEKGIADFSTLEVKDARVTMTSNKGAVFDGDACLLPYGEIDFKPVDPGWLATVGSLAKDGTVSYGPMATVGLSMPSHGGQATLQLGELQRLTGGTLLLSELTDFGSLLGGDMKFTAKGYGDGELLPADITIGSANLSLTHHFVQNDAEKGIVFADTTDGLEGGADAIARVAASTTLADDATVGRLTIEGQSAQLTIPAGKTLTIADRGLLFASYSDNYTPIVGGGTIDFGTKEGVVWSRPTSSKNLYLKGADIAFTGSGGMTFVGRSGDFASGNCPVFRLSDSGTFAQWTGPTRIIDCVYYMDGQNSIPHAVDSGDIYIEGNGLHGGSLHTPGGFVFNNHVHLSGVGATAKYRAVWADGQYTFKGPVTLEGDAIIYVQNRWTECAFNDVIDGPGGFGITSQNTEAPAQSLGYANFKKVNTYTGGTRILGNASIFVDKAGWLGSGPVRIDFGDLIFNGHDGAVLNDTVTGPDKGELHVIGAGRVRFTKPVDIARINNVNTADEIGAGMFEFSDSFRVGGFLKSHFATLFATEPGAKLELTGAEDYSTDVAVDAADEASVALVKTGANIVTLESASDCSSVEVKEGTLKFADAGGILTDADSISFWLDASDEDTLTYDPETTYVTEWRSKVGEATFKADKAGGARYPRYGYDINGRKAVTFAVDTSQAKRERLSDFDHTLAMRTTFVVARCTRYSHDWVAILGRTTSDDKDVGPTLRLSSGEKAIRASGLAQGAGYLRVNGKQSCLSVYPWALNETAVITAEMTANSSGNVAIGGYCGNRDFSGQICEVIEFNRQLTSAERAHVEKYLADKWGVAGVAGDGASLVKSTAVTVAEGATLDLNGHSAVIDTLDGTGSIVNTSGKKVTLKVKNSGTFNGTVGDDVELKLKQGLLLLIR